MKTKGQLIEGEVTRFKEFMRGVVPILVNLRRTLDVFYESPVPVPTDITALVCDFGQKKIASVVELITVVMGESKMPEETVEEDVAFTPFFMRDLDRGQREVAVVLQAINDLYCFIPAVEAEMHVEQELDYLALLMDYTELHSWFDLAKGLISLGPEIESVAVDLATYLGTTITQFQKDLTME